MTAILFFSTPRLPLRLTVGNGPKAISDRSANANLSMTAAHGRTADAITVGCWRAFALQCRFSGRRPDCGSMIARVAISVLLLPLLALALPLMFALAWVHEAIDDRAPPRSID
jgi:hypothetical protein